MTCTPIVRAAAITLVAVLFAPSVVPLASARAGTPASDISRLQAAFEAQSGAKLVFQERAMPAGRYYDRMPELSQGDRLAAARIALAEVEKYPRGYLGDMGVRAIGVFDALISNKGDGYRPYNKEWAGYLYYGLWNGDDAIVAAYYTNGQLPLTLHHEIFHHVDGTHAGTTDYDRYFRADDQRFEDALAGAQPYPAPRIDAADLAALRERRDGSVLRTTVSGYAAKSAGEDQAETARHFMTSLPDALVQMVEHPESPGSQRMLHVMAQYQRALGPAGPAGAGSPGAGPDVQWFVDVALGRHQAKAKALALQRAIAQQSAQIRERWQPRDSDAAFTVWGREDARGVNWTLRADIDRMARDVQALARAAANVPEGRAALRAAVLRNLRLLARYQRFIGAHWSITEGTQASFDQARALIIATLPSGPTDDISGPANDNSARDLAARLTAASYADLAEGISARGTLRGALAKAAPARTNAHLNTHLSRVDRAIADPALRAAIRRVQPAAVRFDNGSGVNIDARGVVLTAAHVVDRKGARKQVLFPDGTRLQGTVTAIDHTLDLALVTLEGAAAHDLPFATLAAKAPERGDRVVAIGQPGQYTPSGEPTGYHAWYVSVGVIRGFLPDRLGDQSLGRTKHDAWTYWGHSGCPLFDDQGRIVAMHNSWDSTTAMRHAVTWEAISHFLADNTN